jgi:hypothetical protein
MDLGPLHWPLAWCFCNKAISVLLSCLQETVREGLQPKNLYTMHVNFTKMV